MQHDKRRKAGKASRKKGRRTGREIPTPALAEEGLLESMVDGRGSLHLAYAKTQAPDHGLIKSVS